MYEVALFVLITMAAAAGRAVSGGRRAAWLLLTASVVWPFVNRPIEGGVLWVLSPGHGLTVSDLLAGLGVLGALWVLVGRPGVRRPAPVNAVQSAHPRAATPASKADNAYSVRRSARQPDGRE